MSVELVTGYSGVGEDGEPNRHVSSAEDGARQAGTVGLGSYVLSTGSKLSATMEDANTLVVADGDAIMNGRHVSLPDTTSFTIPTGVQGKKVSNLAVLRYEKAADSVESVTPLVLTGEPSADAPTDPAYSEGSILDGDSPVDMPLYRVITDGINAEDPEPLFDLLASTTELRDLVSQSVEPMRFTKLTSDPQFDISGIVLGGAVAVISFRWVNTGEFQSQAWSAGVQLARMEGWESTREHQSVCTDFITADHRGGGVSVASAIGDTITWRTSQTVAVSAGMWHEAQLVFPVTRAS